MQRQLQVVKFTFNTATAPSAVITNNNGSSTVIISIDDVLAVFLLLSLAALLPPETPAPLFLPLELLSQQHLHCVQQEKMLSTPVPLF